LGEDYYKDLLDQFLIKRKMICATLHDIGFEPNIPKGGYYVLANISSLPGKTSKERAMFLLEKTGVACVPGEAFYHNEKDGYDLARFCFAKSDVELEEACMKLQMISR